MKLGQPVPLSPQAEAELTGVPPEQQALNLGRPLFDEQAIKVEISESGALNLDISGTAARR